MYLVYNQHLLFSWLSAAKSRQRLTTIDCRWKDYAGKDLLNFFEEQIRTGCQSQQTDSPAADWIWNCWTGRFRLGWQECHDDVRALFHRRQKKLMEIKNPYYKFRDTHETCQMILGICSIFAKFTNYQRSYTS